MNKVYVLIKATPEGAAVLSRDDGQPLTFRDPLLTGKLAAGFASVGTTVECVEVDLDAEEIILPRERCSETLLDNFGLSRGEQYRIARAIAGRSSGNDPEEIGGMGVQP